MSDQVIDKIYTVAPQIAGDVLEALGITYKRQGRHYIFSLRDERTPSAKMLIENGYTTDFGDGWNGSMFTLWERVRGVDFKTALKEIAAIAGVSEEGVYTPKTPDPAPSLNGSAKTPRPTATYEYTDEEGTVLYRHVRVEPGYNGKPKSFVWQRPDGKGGWIDGLSPDIRRVPYSLPDILMGIREEGRVFIAEGEKDVHTLQDWGFPATSSKDWQPEFDAIFKGAEVIVLRDNDDAGRKAGTAIAERLKPTAKSIVVLDFPELHTGGDVTDWKAKGGTKDDLLRRIEKAKAAEETAKIAVPAGWTLPSMESYGQPIPPAQWAVEDMFTRGTVNMVYGASASLKTMVLMDVCCHIASGFEWMGRATFEPRPVVWINSDTPHWMLLERRQALCKKLGVPHEIAFHMLSFPDPAVDLTSPEQSDIIRKLILQTRAWLVVIDCLREVIPYDVDENSSGMGAALKPLKLIAAQTRASFAIIHHESKDSDAGQFRGSSAIAAALDSSLRVVREDVPSATTPVISVEPKKQREFPVSAKRLIFEFTHRGDGRTLETAGFVRDNGEFDPKLMAEKTVFEYLLSCPGETKNQLESQSGKALAGLAQKRVREAVNSLMLKGFVKGLRSERGGMELYTTEKGSAFYDLSPAVRHSPARALPARQ